jgi:hypothetical protein
MHYLLRQNPYNIMWGGGYVVINDHLEDISSEEILLGISTYECYESFLSNNSDLESKSYIDKVRFIEENGTRWNRINVWDEAMEFFDWNNTHSAKYTGYLVNHTQRLAVCLADYFEQSLMGNDGDVVIDPIPVLTETGGGTGMALYNGLSIESTEKLAGKWCGERLQILEELPADYTVIQCCFAEIWGKTKYLYAKYGLDTNGFVLGSNGERFQATSLDVFGRRGKPSYIKAELTDEKVLFKGVHVDEI